MELFFLVFVPPAAIAEHPFYGRKKPYLYNNFAVLDPIISRKGIVKAGYKKEVERPYLKPERISLASTSLLS